MQRYIPPTFNDPNPYPRSPTLKPEHPLQQSASQRFTNGCNISFY
jgi:hypothetical protein